MESLSLNFDAVTVEMILALAREHRAASTTVRREGTVSSVTVYFDSPERARNFHAACVRQAWHGQCDIRRGTLNPRLVFFTLD